MSAQDVTWTDVVFSKVNTLEWCWWNIWMGEYFSGWLNNVTSIHAAHGVPGSPRPHQYLMLFNVSFASRCWDWNSGPHSCQWGALPLSYTSSPSVHLSDDHWLRVYEQISQSGFRSHFSNMTSIFSHVLTSYVLFLWWGVYSNPFHAKKKLAMLFLCACAHTSERICIRVLYVYAWCVWVDAFVCSQSMWGRQRTASRRRFFSPFTVGSRRWT